MPAMGWPFAHGEGDAENLRAHAGIIVEHLIKIPEAEEEQRVWRKLTLHLHVLLHHRGEFVRLGGHGKARRMANPSGLAKPFSGKGRAWG